MTAVEARQIELLRQALPRERAALGMRLTDEARVLARRAIARAWPELTPVQRKLKLVELQYGDELAGKLERWLAAHEAGA